MKIYKSEDYNYIFDDKNGKFARWGKTFEDDPDMSPIGPEIADIQISSICHSGCKFCYQSNTPNGLNMSLGMFKTIIDKMPTVLQVALATGDLEANADIWSMMAYCREKGIVPNITISGNMLSDSCVENLKKYAGAVAVSHYSDDMCFYAVKRLTDAGLTQVNIHQLLSNETIDDCFSVLKSTKTDYRLENLNAVVFLSLKKKGRGIGFNIVDTSDFEKLVNYGMENNISIGFDSCGSTRFLDAIKNRKDYESIKTFVEPCESSCFSVFINVFGKYLPCSFCEGEFEGIDVPSCNEFLNDVWMNNKTVEWRNRLLKCERSCPIYEI